MDRSKFAPRFTPSGSVSPNPRTEALAAYQDLAILGPGMVLDRLDGCARCLPRLRDVREPVEERHANDRNRLVLGRGSLSRHQQHLAHCRFAGKGSLPLSPSSNRQCDYVSISVFNHPANCPVGMGGCGREREYEPHGAPHSQLEVCHRKKEGSETGIEIGACLAAEYASPFLRCNDFLVGQPCDVEEALPTA